MRIIVSGGGTGGHIYPALALIERLKQVEPDTQVLYVGTDRGLENKIVPAAGLELKVLHTQGFKRSLSLENFKTAYLFLKAVHDAKKIIKEFKPDVVLGTGGYVSGAVLYAAAKLHVPTVIHEQNSVVGITNKFLSRYVDEIAIAFDAARDQFPAAKVTMCGNPRAQQAAANANSDFSWTSYGLSDDKPVLMIFGAAKEHLRSMPVWFRPFLNSASAIIRLFLPRVKSAMIRLKRHLKTLRLDQTSMSFLILKICRLKCLKLPAWSQEPVQPRFLRLRHWAFQRF